MLNKADRIRLRSIAQNAPDLVFIGKEGYTPTVEKQILNNLFAHELVKIKVQKTSSQSVEELADIIAQNCKCEIVTTIGTKIVTYKKSDKEKIKHLL